MLVILVICRYITSQPPVQMEEIVNVKDLGGKDYRNTALLRGGGSISILWLKEIQYKKILHLKMNWMIVITTQVYLLLHFFLFARYWFFKPFLYPVCCDVIFVPTVGFSGFMCILDHVIRQKV